MNCNKKCVQNMYKWVIGTFLFLQIACTTVDPESMRILTEEYPQVYEHIYTRDGDALLEFVDHPDSVVRSLAWRGIMNSEVEDLDLQIQKVMIANTESAWASLWFKELDDKHFSYFHQLWRQSPHLRSGLLTLFTEQGNRESFELLIRQEKTGDEAFDYKLAYATGARSRLIQLTTEEELQLIDHALGTKKATITQAYLYGYYRGRKSFSPEAEQYLINEWQNYYPIGEAGNQSIVRILSQNQLDQVLLKFTLDKFERMDVQLAVEIAQAIARNEATERSPIVLNALLNHRNPNVQISALQAIQQHPEIAERLFSDIMNKIALVDYRDPSARMTAFNTINEPERYFNEMQALAENEPYLQGIKYQILGKVYSDDEMMDTFSEDLQKENYLLKFYAIQGLSSWWRALSEEGKVELIDDVKAIINNAFEMQDRSVAVSLSSFVGDSLLFEEGDYGSLERHLRSFSLPEDVEVFQAYSNVLFERYKDQAEPFIQELAEQDNTALNNTLSSTGWDVEAESGGAKEFRKPDWKRVAKISANPYVVIETAKGDITLKLDVFKAPVTIAGMNALIKDRAYNGTPFHRVIPNFVIQGGDVETGNGFGGPDFVVPTEGSETMYHRGVVGIASAGLDTGGSQFFIMHQWKPHLNGRYTVIGEVVEGMDVVDRITQGDVIERMRWF
ncbi:MAG: peptidylprolyl isomerase [Balneolaceae bacterium]|nr:peptidylprolyl isomerase [Balneolaceae bacterium]